MEIFDAVISGYGPTGATLANLLGSYGMRVAVLDRQKEIYDKPRAITADHEAMRAFQAVGLAHTIAEGTSPHPGTDFVGINGDVIKRFYPMPSPGPLGWEPTFMFYQPKLEAQLRAGVDRFPNIKVLLEHTVERHQQLEELVEVEVSSVSGQKQVLKTRYLLACEGARSGIRAQMGVPLHDLAFDEWWVVVDAQLTKDIDLPERCVQYCRPSRPGTYIVGPERLRRWEIKVMPGESPEMFNDTDHLQQVLSSFVDISAIEVQRVAVYRFHAVVAERWRDRRVFLVGDAAHQMPPFMGQGLCAGVRDAYNLAWKLDAVLNGQAADSLLDTYAAERKPHVQQVVEHAKSFGLIIGELNEEAALARDLKLGAELRDGTAVTVRQAFIPGLTHGLLGSVEEQELAAGAGQLFPQPKILQKAGPSLLFDDVVGKRFAVVCDSPELANAAVRQILTWPIKTDFRVFLLDSTSRSAMEVMTNVKVIQPEEPFIESWLKRFESNFAVVRPDGFAYAAGKGASQLEQHLLELARKLGVPEVIESM